QQPVRRAPDDIRVLRIDVHGAEVPRPDADVLIAVGELPRLAAIVGAIEPALLGLDLGIDSARIRRGHSDTDLAPDSFGQSLDVALVVARPAEPFPGIAAVVGAIEPAAQPAAGILPGPPPRLPHTGEENIRIRGVKADVTGAGVMVLGQYLLPGLA